VDFFPGIGAEQQLPSANVVHIYQYLITPKVKVILYSQKHKNNPSHREYEIHIISLLRKWFEIHIA